MAVGITDRLFGENSSVAIKAPVLAVATTPITLSGLQTIGGYTTQSGDRVLVIAQDDATTNGIYNASTAAWTRTGDFDGNNDVVCGTMVVNVADTNIFYRVSTANPVLIGSSDISFEAVSASLTQAAIGQAFYPQTAAELAVSIIPSAYNYPPGNALRYGVDPTGTNDSTTAIQNWIDATWAMYQYVDTQGLWDGGGGAAPILELPPGKYMVSGTMYLPNGVTFRGKAHPAHTINHTRLIMNSTGTNPPNRWAASTAYFAGEILQPSTPNGYWYTCTVAGTSGGSAPSWPSSGSVTDGGVTWAWSGVTSTNDNRNTPMFKFRRGSLPPSAGNGSLVNAGFTSTLENLEFWFVDLSNSFSNPLSGASWLQRNYPLGAVIALDVDLTDTRIIDCVFQNTPCAIWASNINTGSSSGRGDGFSPSPRGLSNLFIEDCEFDAAPAHVWISGCSMDLFFRKCHFYSSAHFYYGNTAGSAGSGGSVAYEECYFQGRGAIDAYGYSGASFGGGASPAANQFQAFVINGCVIEAPQGAPFLSLNKSIFVDISRNSFWEAATNGGILVIDAIAGRISDNALDSQGANASAGTDLADYPAAIKALGCQNLHICGNSISASFSATYNGFGILTGDSADQTSQYNFVSSNAVTAPYNGGNFNSQSRYINLATADVRGVNYNASTSTTEVEAGAMSPATGSFTGTGTGFSGTAPSFACTWSRSGGLVTLTIGIATGTSNADTFTITGLPAEIQPTATTQWIKLPSYFTDNSGGGLTASSEVDVQVTDSGTLTLALNGSASGWGTSSTKGFNQPVSFTYGIM